MRKNPKIWGAATGVFVTAAFLRIVLLEPVTAGGETPTLKRYPRFGGRPMPRAQSIAAKPKGHTFLSEREVRATPLQRILRRRAERQRSLPQQLFETQLSPIRQCRRSRRVRRPVAYQSLYGSTIDWLFFAPVDAEGRKYAEDNPARAVMYEPGAYESDPGTPPSRDPRLLFASRLGVRCLPTRVHYITEGARRYLEILEGELVYEDMS